MEERFRLRRPAASGRRRAARGETGNGARHSTGRTARLPRCRRCRLWPDDGSWAGFQLARPSGGGGLPHSAAPVGEQQQVRPAASRHQDLTEPAQRCFLAGLAGLAQCLDDAWKSKKSSRTRGLSARSGRSRQRNMRTPRLSKTPPSVYACRPNSPPLAPTSAPVSSSGGKNPGNADEAVTAIGTVARPTWMRSMRNGVPRLPAHHQQAVAVERAQASLAQVGGEDVQLRPLGQLEQAGVAVEILLVVVFQQPRSRQLAVRAAQQPARPAQREAQGKAPGDPIADIEADEARAARTPRRRTRWPSRCSGPS